MKYVCLGFYDESKFAAMSQEQVQRMFDECFAYDTNFGAAGIGWAAKPSNPVRPR